MISAHRPILFTVRLSIFLKELSVDLPLADATFKALLVVNLAKSGATLESHGFGTDSTFACKKINKS